MEDGDFPKANDEKVCRIRVHVQQKWEGLENLSMLNSILFYTIPILQVRLEEKQRAKRRKREAAAANAAEALASGDMEEAERLNEEAAYQPLWFSKEYDPLTNTMIHVYKGGYWEAKQEGKWDELNLPNLY